MYTLSTFNFLLPWVILVKFTQNKQAMREFFLLLTSFSVCQFLTAQAVFSGVLEHYESDQVLMWKQSDFDLPFRYDTIYLSDQSFTVNIETDHSVLVNIEFFLNSDDEKTFIVPLFLNPGDTSKIYLDFSKRDEKGEWMDCRFEGKNAKGHELFHQFRLYPLFRYLEPFYSLLEEKEPGAMFEHFEMKINSLISPYQELKLGGAIDARYAGLAINYIKASIVNSLLASFYLEGDDWFVFRKKNKEMADAFIDRLIQYFPPLKKTDFLTRPYSSYLITSLARDRIIKRGGESFADIRDTLVSVNGVEYNISRDLAPILDLKNEQLKEYIFAYQLDEYYRIFLVDDIVDQLNEALAFFQAVFPNSRYLEHLYYSRLKNANAIRVLSTVAPRQAESAKYFSLWTPFIVDDAGLMEDLKFKNEYIDLGKGGYYVDIWASWCRPCLEEMKYNYQTDSMLETHGIERLYISIDEPVDHGKWLSILYDYHLGGGHVLAGEQLKQFLRQELKSGTSPFPVPRYLLVKDGKIIHNAAAGPSNLHLLTRQVKELIRN